MRPRELFKIWRAMVVALATLLLAEQYAATLSGRNSALYVEDPRLFWALNPGRRYDGAVDAYVQINSLGMRGPEPDGVHPSILLLGDSCTYGFGVANGQTIDARLQQELTNRLRRPVRVYNGGVPGYSSCQARELLGRLAPVLRPDVVVSSCFYADIAPGLVSDWERTPGPPFDHVRAAMWKSHLYRRMRARFLGQDHLGGAFEEPMAHQGGPVRRVSSARYLNNLHQTFEIARRNGASLVVGLVLPNRRLSTPGASENIRMFLSRPRAPDALGVDLCARWLDRGVDTRPFFWDDKHPTAAGCSAVARDLAEILVDDPRFERVVRSSREPGRGHRY